MTYIGFSDEQMREAIPYIGVQFTDLAAQPQRYYPRTVRSQAETGIQGFGVAGAGT